MRIGFIDPTPWRYTADTPYERPLGGSHSALCYLAAELARLGHAVTIHNGAAVPSRSRGVQIANLDAARSSGGLNTFDALVVLNAAIGRELRRDARVSVPMVLWNQHSYDQAGIAELQRLNERKSWTGFAFVSEWQLAAFCQRFWIPRERSRVMRNAVSPVFANGPAGIPWFMSEAAPTLFYTSTPFRGLDLLLQVFPGIRNAIPGTRLRIFSSMGVYQVPAEQDRYRELYRQARQIEGVEYIGSIGQSQLAKELDAAAAFAYPSTFEETSCIAALEAMAVGAVVLTTRLGALPETTDRFGMLVDWQADRARLGASFAEMAIATLQQMRQDPAAAAARREEQIKFIHEKYLWSVRALEWSNWLAQLAGGGG